MAHEADDMDTPTIAIIGLIAAGATFAAIYLAMWLYYWVSDRQERAGIEVPYAEAERVMDRQQAILNEPEWIDQNIGQLRIPVPVAMELVVDQLQATPEDAGVTPARFAQSDATMTAENTAADDAEGEEVTPGPGGTEDPDTTPLTSPLDRPGGPVELEQGAATEVEKAAPADGDGEE